jgi:hypothetical protein
LAHLVVCRLDGWLMERLRRAVCLVPHRAAEFVREADLSAQAPRSARPQMAAWSADRCVADWRPEWRHVRNVRARQVACRRAAALSEQQLAEPSAPGAQAQPQEEVAAAVAVPLVRRRAEAGVPSALPVEVAAEHAAAEAAQRAAGVGAAEQPASEERRVGPAGRVSRQAEAPEALVLRAAARPSAAAPSSPSRLRLAPARRSAVTMRFGHAPRRLRVASS